VKTVNLDGVATAGPVREVSEVMLPWLWERHANPASPHREGAAAADALEEARAHVAGLVGAEPESVVFTSGATEANNLAIKGAARMAYLKGRSILAIPVHEHPSLLHPSRALDRAPRWELVPIPVNRTGLVHTSSLPDGPLALLGMAHAHAELGALQPAAELVQAARERGGIALVDATLTAGRIPLDMDSLGRPDLLSLSFHHMGGPMGVGALIVEQGLALPPLLEGGAQERGYRPGTPNLAGCVGAGVAARLGRERVEARARVLSELGSLLMKGLLDAQGVHLTGPDLDSRLPGHVSVRVEGINGQALVMAMGERGILVATASPCADEAGLPSASLLAAGYSREEAGSAVLFCVPPTSEIGITDIQRVTRCFREEVQRLRVLAGRMATPHR